MEAEARYTWVGAAVLALLAALIGTLLWLKGTGNEAGFQRYAIHFERQALDGLEVGAVVTLRGIRIGRVVDYALADHKLNRVRVEVRLDRRAPVRTNTVAVISRNYVTGIASIALITREPPGPPLVQVPEDETYPVIAEGVSEIDDVANRVGKVGDMASFALSNINQLLSSENRETAMATIRSLRDLSLGLSQRLVALDTTLRSLSAAADNVGGAAAQLGQAGERAAVVAERAGTRVDLTLAEAERTLVEARRAIERIAVAGNAVQEQVSAAAQRLDATASSLDHQLDAAMAELRLSTETATRALDRLRDPRAMLLGPSPAQLGPGERLP